MTALHRLSAAFIKFASPGKYNDGSGLWLHKRKDGGSQWILRVVVNGRRREMGLGGYPGVGLKDARDLAARWRKHTKLGDDPIKLRDKERREAAKADSIFENVALAAFAARKAELKDDGKAGRWFSPLEHHVLPKLGNLPIDQIDQRDIAHTLGVIWHTKAETARKAINRLGIVLQYGAAMGFNVDLNAVAKAKALLGKSRHQPQNTPALHWKNVPDFYSSISEENLTNLALRLLILTGTRSYSLRHINIDQISDQIWTIPGRNMKATNDKLSDFRVPLSNQANNVIQLALPFATEGYLFPGIRKGVISDATMSRMMERRGMKERPHGFRSSLRTWLADCTDAPEEVAETVLAHSPGSKVVRAYRRTDFLEQRAVLMQRWADHITGRSNLKIIDKAYKV